MLSPVTYDRKAKLYFASTDSGQIVADTRPEAESQYLSAVAPELAHKVRAISNHRPDLSERAMRAAFIVINGGVKLYDIAPVTHSGAQIIAEVASQNSDETYQIYARGGLMTCNCPDGNPSYGDAAVNGAPATKFSEHCCKHIVAVTLYR